MYSFLFTCINYKRRFFGGRHPLCGIDVLSSIEIIFKPAVFKARIDVSRPLPRPLITTSTFAIPISIAFNAAALAAVWAAKGVFFLAPLNPELPADAQHKVFPKISVIVTIVLLNVVFTLATPTFTDFFCCFFCFWNSGCGFGRDSLDSR